MSYEPFVANLVRILEKNGYPDKRVALPLEKMYAVAYDKQLNFNKALELLRQRGIDHEKTNEKLVFFPAELPPATEGPAAADDASTDTAPNLADLMAQAMRMMQSMSPEQLAELQRQVANLSDDDKAAMLQKARDMGLA